MIFSRIYFNSSFFLEEAANEAAKEDDGTAENGAAKDDAQNWAFLPVFPLF